MGKRCFVAVDIEDKVRKNLVPVYKGIDSLSGRIKTVPPGNLHITLKFLGDCADEQIRGVKEVLRSIALKTRRFDNADS